MKLDVKEIKREITEAPAGAPRLAFLLELCGKYYRANPKEAKVWAEEARKIAQKLGDRSSEAKALFRIACSDFQLCDYKKTEKTLEEAIAILEKSGPAHPELCNPLFLLGMTYARLGRLRDSLSLLKKALGLCENKPLKSVEVLIELGGVSIRLSEYAAALEYEYQALEILDGLDDPICRSVVFSNLGAIYLEVRMYEQAEEHLQRALTLARENSDESGEVTRLLNLASLSHKRGDRALALKRAKEALALSQKIGDLETEAYLSCLLGDLALDEGSVADAQKQYKRALELSEEMSLGSILPACLVGLGDATLRSGKKKEAIRLFERALSIATQQDQLPMRVEALRLLAVGYEKAKELPSALKAFNQLVQLEADLHNENRERAIVEIHAQKEIAKADRERKRMEALALDAEGRAKRAREEAESRNSELTGLALQLVQKNEFLVGIKEELESTIKPSKRSRELLERIDNHIRSDRDWETFDVQFHQVHKDFLRKLSSEYPTLTPSELKIAALIKLNLATKSIANLLCLSVRTVENHRQGIRKKLKLPLDANLVSFFTSL